MDRYIVTLTRTLNRVLRLAVVSRLKCLLSVTVTYL